MKLPATTVARLSKYRRMLSRIDDENTHIFSHDLANLLNLTPEQVRRDLMLVGLTGNHRKGYNIRELVDFIVEELELPKRISLKKQIVDYELNIDLTRL